jgi:hypothetical protein
MEDGTPLWDALKEATPMSVEMNDAARDEQTENPPPVEMNREARKETGKETFAEKIKSKVSSFDQGVKAMNEERRRRNAAGKAAEKAAYNKAFIEGRAKRGAAKGRKAGMSSFGSGGILGGIAGTAGSLSKHIEIGPKGNALFGGSSKGDSGFGLGFQMPKTEDVGFGFGSPRKSTPRKKGRKKGRMTRAQDPYADFGF